MSAWRPGLMLAALLAWGLLALPPVRQAMESVMVIHALQIALLGGIGGLMGHAFGPIHTRELAGLNESGVTGTVLALLTLLFWLLPLSLDHGAWEAVKFLSLPLLLGLPLARSWRRLPVLARAFIWANAIPMALAMGWLYREAPVRLCNNYLAGDQQVLGLALWLVGLAIAGYWAARALFGL